MESLSGWQVRQFAAVHMKAVVVAQEDLMYILMQVSEIGNFITMNISDDT